MAIEIVDLPIKNGDFPYSYVSLPEGNDFSWTSRWLVWLVEIWVDVRRHVVDFRLFGLSMAQILAEDPNKNMQNVAASLPPHLSRRRLSQVWVPLPHSAARSDVRGWDMKHQWYRNQLERPKSLVELRIWMDMVPFVCYFFSSSLNGKSTKIWKDLQEMPMTPDETHAKRGPLSWASGDEERNQYPIWQWSFIDWFPILSRSLKTAYQLSTGKLDVRLRIIFWRGPRFTMILDWCSLIDMALGHNNYKKRFLPQKSHMFSFARIDQNY